MRFNIDCEPANLGINTNKKPFIENPTGKNASV